MKREMTVTVLAFVAVCAMGGRAAAQGAGAFAPDFAGRGSGTTGVIDLLKRGGGPAPPGVKVDYREYGGGDHGHGGGGGQVYRPSRPWNWSRVMSLAHEVDGKSEHVYREAYRGRHHGDYWEDRAIADLGTLATRAEHFHRQVERSRGDSWHTRADYQELVRVFNRASASLRYAHAFEHIRNDFEGARRSLQELDFYYRYERFRDPHYDDHGHGGWRWDFRWRRGR